jgi:hypothetical protein
LVGNASVGYALVTAIASDTSLTTSTALTITGNQTCNCIEQPTISASGNTGVVVSIANNTNLVWSNGATAGPVAYTIGNLISTAFVYWNVYIGSGGSGTTLYVSTQRTTPFKPAGYTTSFRRLGGLCLTATNTTLTLNQLGSGPDRRCEYNEVDLTLSALPFGAGVTNWTTISVSSRGVPPTAKSVLIKIFRNRSPA